MNHPEKLELLLQSVLARKPVLKKIYDTAGEQTISEYIQGSLNSSQPWDKSQELIAVFEEEVKKRLGPEVAQSAARQLYRYYQATTAHHHHPTSHPFFFNWDLANSILSNKNRVDNILVLGCANVTLSNSSFPRGHIFHDQDGKIKHLSLIPSTDSQACVYNTLGFTAKDLERIKKTSFNLKLEHQTLLKEVVETVYSHESVLSQKYYTDQITVSNFLFWKKYFNDNVNLIYITQEDLTNSLLLKHHLHTPTIIHKILFGSEYAPLINKYFNGIIGCFNSEKQTGTYLFWATPDEHNRRVGLEYKDGQLVSRDKKIVIPLTPESIETAIQAGQLIPSMMLTFMVLCFYYGLKCLGGFDQPNYLTQMKKAFLAMQAEAGLLDNQEPAQKVITNELGGDFVLSLGKINKKVFPATALDLILYRNKDTFVSLAEQMDQITIKDALLPLLPEFYKMTYHSGEQDAKLTDITAEEIAASSDKIKPIISIS